MEVPIQLANSENVTYEDCSICFQSFTKKAYIDECLHPFCYDCIVTWTQVKAVCPLCVRPITKILHSFRSETDYDIYSVIPPERDILASIDDDFYFPLDDTDSENSYGDMESTDMDLESVLHEVDDLEYDLNEGVENYGCPVFDYLNGDDEDSSDGICDEEDKDRNQDDSSDIDDQTFNLASSDLENAAFDNTQEASDYDSVDEFQVSFPDNEEDDNDSNYRDSEFYVNHNAENTDNSDSEYEEEYEQENEVEHFDDEYEEDKSDSDVQFTDDNDEDEDENSVNEFGGNSEIDNEGYDMDSLSCSDDDYDYTECHFAT